MAEMATITSKRQLTIPVFFYKLLNFKAGQKVVISEDQGILKIIPALTLIDKLAGSVILSKHFRGLSLKKIVNKAKKEHFLQK